MEMAILYCLQQEASKRSSCRARKISSAFSWSCIIVCFNQRNRSRAKLNASTTGFASGRATARVPWKHIFENHQDFVEPRYLPQGRKIKDPSSMVKEEIEDILSFWRARQTIDSGKGTFRFKQCFVDSANRDLQQARYGGKQKSTAGGRKKSGKRKANDQLPAEAGGFQLTLSPHQESNTQEPVDETDEGAGQDVAAVPYTFGLPSGGNCNMSPHQGEVPNATAGGAFTSATAAKDMAMSTQGGINPDAFNFDPELQQIALAMQPSAYTSQQSDFLQGGLFDNFLESLATENAPFFQDEGALRLPSSSGLNDIEHGGGIEVMPGSVHLDNRPGDIVLPRRLTGGAQDTHITPSGEASPLPRPGDMIIGVYSTIARPDVHNNDMGQTMELQDNPRSCIELAPRPPTVAGEAQAAAEPASSGNFNNDMGKAMALDDNSHPNEVQNPLPNEVQHPLPNEIQDSNSNELQNDAPIKRRRGRPRKVVESENTNEQIPSLKRGQDAVDGAPDGANKKAKTTTQPRKKAAKRK
jgi:hypothetical protein